MPGGDEPVDEDASLLGNLLYRLLDDAGRYREERQRVEQAGGSFAFSIGYSARFVRFR